MSAIAAATIIYTPSRVKNTPGRIQEASPSACELLGYPQEELESMVLKELIVAPEPSAVLATLEEEVYRNREALSKITLRGRRIQRLRVEVSAHALGNDRQGQILWVLRDVPRRDRGTRSREIFSSLAHQLSEVRTPREAAMAIINAADELFGWDATHLNLYPQEMDHTLAIINLDTVDGVRMEFPAGPESGPISPQSRRVLEEGACLYLIDPDNPGDAAPRDLVSFGDNERLSASLMYVPIRKGKNNFGVLSIQSYTPLKYDQEDLEALQVLADHCSGALERILAEDKLREQVFVTAQFAELGRHLSTASTPQETSMVILETADKLFGWDSCYVAVYSPEEDLVRGVVALDLLDGERQVIALSDKASPPGPLFREIIEDGARLVLRKETDNPSPVFKSFGDTARSSRSLMYAPVRSGTKVVGILSIQSYNPDFYTNKDLEGLQALADHCGGGLMRAYAENDLRQSEARLSLVTSQIPTIMWAVDRDLRITLLLGWALHALNVRSEEHIGTTLQEFLSPHPFWESALWMHERALLGLSGTFEMTLGDRIFHSYVEPLKDRDGEVIGCINVAHDVTQRVHAEEDLRKFKKAIEQGASSVIITNNKHEIEYVNSAFESLTGYTRDEMIGKLRSWESIGVNSSEYLPTLRHHLDSGEPFNGVIMNRRKSGEQYYEGKTITPLRDAQGAITHYVETGKDITDKLLAEQALRKAHDELEQRVRERTEDLQKANDRLLMEIRERTNAEEELERSLSLLRATLESTTDGIMVVDLDGRLVSFNQKWLQMWQVNALLVEELSSVELHKLLASQLVSSDALLPFVQRLESSGEESFQVLELLDGKVFESYSKASMIGGKSVGRVWSFRDITLRRRHEEALARSEAIYREAIENASGVPYRFVYAKRQYDFMGDGIRELLELDPDEITKEGIEAMTVEYNVLDVDGPRKLRDYRLAVRAGEISKYRVDLKLKAKSGKIKWVNDCSVPMRDPKTGEIIGTLGILQDITERKRFEEEARIQQERLIQSEKLVALGTLVSGVAHEINNPNNFIMLNVPTLKDSWESIRPILEDYYEENGEFLMGGLNYTEMRETIPMLYQGLLSGAQRIRNIVQELRDFARPHPHTQREPVDVNAVVRSALILLNNVTSSSTVNFQLSLGENVPVVMGSFQRLEQVIINLVQNACQALTNREQFIKVSTRYDDFDGYVVIEVEDEGKGITPEQLKQITDPFFTTKRDTGGTGLGLSISSNIVHNHGGILEFHSVPGKGTLARVKFLSGVPSGMSESSKGKKT